MVKKCELNTITNFFTFLIRAIKRWFLQRILRIYSTMSIKENINRFLFQQNFRETVIPEKQLPTHIYAQYSP